MSNHGEKWSNIAQFHTNMLYLLIKLLNKQAGRNKRVEDKSIELFFWFYINDL